MFKRFWWVFLVMIPVGSIAGLLVAAVVTYVMPKKYESEAVIEVKPMAESKITPQFFGTEFEKIKSHDSLAKVVDNLELINKWGVDKETAIRILKGIVNTQNIRGTDLISIRVRHTSKENARDITAEVANVYRDYRMDIQRPAEEQGLLELKKAVRDYADTQRNHETDKALLQSMKLKLTNEILMAKMQERGVVIHEEPQIAQAPISPNVPLNLILGTALGFLCSPLLSLPVMLLLSRLMPIKEGGRKVDPP